MTEPVYLDHAASTPMLPEAAEVVRALLGHVGNPSSRHGSGRAARKIVEESRELVAQCVGARPAEVIFTSGGTEADNLAVKGTFWAQPGRRVVLSSTTEHHAVTDAVTWLAEAEDAKVELIECDGSGLVDPAAVEDLLARTGADAALLSLILANNETGAVQPVAEIAAACREAGVLMHSDAVQVVGHLPFDFADSSLDLVSISGHKLGGPVGAGALLARREVPLRPLLHGGGQERDVRSGTVDVVGVAGFAAAVRFATERQRSEAVRLARLRDRLIDGVRLTVSGVTVSGPADPGHRLPNLAHLRFDGCDADALLLGLDAAGVDCSAGSACAAGVSQPSPVLLAMGCTDAQARSAVRFSFGHTSTDADVDRVLAVLPEVVDLGRAFASTR